MTAHPSPQPRVLVLTLYAGEAEFDRATSMVTSQAGVTVRHEVIADLPSVEAHRALYSRIEACRNEFDLFVKVDADTVLRSEETLAAVAAIFAEQPDLDHAVFALDDFYTRAPIMGMHAYSSRARWPQSSESLFVDPAPTVPGRSEVFWGDPSPVGSHSPDPSLEQAFWFGVHRAQKAFQPGRRRVRAAQAISQWEALERLWSAFLDTRNLRRGIALIGADLVWRGDLVIGEGGYRDPVVAERLAQVRQHVPTADDAYDRLAPRWRPSARRRFLRFRTLGVGNTTRVGALSLRQALLVGGGDR